MNTTNQPYNDTAIRRAAMNFDVFLRDGGVGASLFFVLLILIVVNAHSLHSLLAGDGWLYWVFSGIGAVGFSLATTAAIRKPTHNWIKFTFPAMDMVLIGLGFAIENGYDVHLYLIILFSLFLGAVLLAMGWINYQERAEEGEAEMLQSELKTANDRLAQLQGELNESQAMIKELQSEVERTKEDEASTESELNDLRDAYQKLKSEVDLRDEKISGKQSEIDQKDNALHNKRTEVKRMEKEINRLRTYETAYLAAEKSRILKKKPENRTQEELATLEKAEKLNGKQQNQTP